MGGVRPQLFVPLAAAAALLAAASWWHGARQAGPSAPPADRAAAAAPRPEGAREGAGARLRFAGRELRRQAPPRVLPSAGVTRGSVEASGPRTAGAASAPSAPPAGPPALRERSGELAGLEREAAGLATARGLLEPEALDARLAELEPAPGESPRDFERRVEDERERLAAEEVLVQHRLAELYETTIYPPGFQVEEIVAAQERQLVRALPPADRSERLRNALGSWEPHRAQPRFGEPESEKAGPAERPDL